MSLLTRTVEILGGKRPTAPAESDPAFASLRDALTQKDAGEYSVPDVRAPFQEWAAGFETDSSDDEFHAWRQVLETLLDGKTRTVYDAIAVLEQSDLWAGNAIPVLAENLPTSGSDSVILTPARLIARRLPFGRYLMRAAKVANLGRIAMHEVRAADLRMLVLSVAESLTLRRLAQEPGDTEAPSSRPAGETP